MENPFKTWGKNSKGIIMGTTAMLGSLNATPNTTTELPKTFEGKKIEIKSEIKKGHDENTFDLSKPAKEKENEVKSNTNIEGGDSPEVETDSLNLAEFCKTGSIEFVNIEARENAINAIADFFKNVDFEYNDVVVEGLSSKERPVFNNVELSIERMELGIQMVTEALNRIFPKERVAEILKGLKSNARVASIFESGITREQFEIIDKETLEELLDKIQGVKISLVKKVKIENLEIEEKIPEPFGNVISVILDQSKSMAGEANEALKIVKEINEKYKKDIKVVSLEGKDKEAHLKTLIDILSDIEIQKENKKEVLVITDEPDNDIRSEEEYNLKVQQVLSLAKNKNVEVIVKVFHPDQQIGGSKMVSLNDYPQALFIDQKSRKNGSETVFWESKTKAWYDSLPNNQIDPQNLSSR